MRPLLVFGLDGASLPVLRNFIQHRPGGVFETIINCGTSRTLLSTLPYFTAPAWTTIATGLSPGKHGVFHWLGRYDHRLDKRPLLSNEHLQTATIWHYVQTSGFRVSVSNFPMEYPAPAVNGRYICGTLAPEEAENTTWPRGLSQRIKASQPSFRFEMNKGLTYVDRREDLKKHILDVGENHLRAMFNFGSPGTADLLFHVVTITDRMQHFFWDAYDPAHPKYGSPSVKAYEDSIFEAYALAELGLTRLLSLSDWANVIIVSDHGMGPSWSAFHADEWLRQEGYLTLDDSGEIDMIRSLAYSAQEPECALYVQRHSRDEAGVSDAGYDALISEIIEKLRALRDSEGRLAMKRVLRADQVHCGQFAALSPDIILEPTEGIHPRPGRSKVVFSTETRLCAGHRPEGVFIGYGADFRAENADHQTIRVEDIFPIITRLSELPEPSGLDGTVPDGLLLATSPCAKASAEIDWSSRVDGPPKQQRESSSMLERLRELGYLE